MSVLYPSNSQAVQVRVAGLDASILSQMGPLYDNRPHSTLFLPKGNVVPLFKGTGSEGEEKLPINRVLGDSCMLEARECQPVKAESWRDTR